MSRTLQEKMRGLLTVAVCLLACLSCKGQTASGGSRPGIFPKGPVIATGENLTFTCNYSLDNISPEITAKDLYFTFNNNNYNVSSPQFSVVDKNAAQLRLSGLHQNLTHKHVYCYLGNEPLIGQTTIQVLDPPLKPYLEDCIVYNWANMTCTWGPVQPPGVKTTLIYSILTYDSSNNPQLHVQGNCSVHRSDKKTNCTIKLDEVIWGDSYVVYLKATNQNVTVYSDTDIRNNIETIEQGIAHLLDHLRRGILLNVDICERLKWPGEIRDLCPHQKAYNCSWKKVDGGDSFFPHIIYHMLIVAEHAELNRTVFSDVTDVDTRKIVKPDQISGLKIHKIENNQRALNVCFTPTSRIHSQLYQVLSRISYSSEYGDRRQVNVTFKMNDCTHESKSTKEVARVDGETELCTSLTGLIPNTEYQVEIDCLPILKIYEQNKCIPTGYWSVKKTSKATTPEDVPGALPNIFPGSFKQDLDETSATIHWQGVPKRERHGTFTEYLITSRELSNPSAFKEKLVPIKGAGDKYDDIVQVPKMNTSYVITVVPLTNIGANQDLQPIKLILASRLYRPKVPEKFAVVGNKSGVYFNWEIVDGASGFTLYWCKGSLSHHTCNEGVSLEGKSFNSTTTSAELFIDTADDVFSYIFAISVEKSVILEDGNWYNISSGMKWSLCTYKIDKDIKAPKHLKALEAGSEHNSIFLSWENPGCAATGYISQYQIEYCKIIDDEKCDEDTEDSAWTTVSETDLDITDTNYKLTGLDADAQYMVRIRSLSDDGKSTYEYLDEAYLVKRSGLSKGTLGTVIAVSIILLILVIIGIVALVRYFKQRLERYRTVIIEPPERVDYHLGGTEEDQGADESNAYVHIDTFSETQLDEHEENQRNDHVAENGHVPGFPLNGSLLNGRSVPMSAATSKASWTSPEQVALLSDTEKTDDLLLDARPPVTPPHVTNNGYSAPQDLHDITSPCGAPISAQHGSVALAGSASLYSDLSSVPPYSTARAGSSPQSHAGGGQQTSAVSITPYSQLDEEPPPPADYVNTCDNADKNTPDSSLLKDSVPVNGDPRYLYNAPYAKTTDLLQNDNVPSYGSGDAATAVSTDAPHTHHPASLNTNYVTNVPALDKPQYTNNNEAGDCGLSPDAGDSSEGAHIDHVSRSAEETVPGDATGGSSEDTEPVTVDGPPRFQQPGGAGYVTTDMFSHTGAPVL